MSNARGNEIGARKPAAPVDVELESRIREIFDEAVMLDPAGRERLVDEAAAGEEPVRQGVRALLDAHDSAGEFFERLVDGIHLADPEDQAGRPEEGVAGRRIGPYRLTRLLGRGGMGAVYLADQVDGNLDRSVALKLLPIGLDNDESRRWFEAERQVLSSLNHPNIARLYQADVAEDGTPYFVMEYVDGMPLSAYCDENRLSVRARFELLLKVLDAVQSAHERLIVHRDLKPSNILVGEDGEPKLLDFGVARVLDPRDSQARGTLTARGVPHTPDYASPEQALGDLVTTASDVYSLGVILYELLTGAMPFQPGLTAAKRLVRTPPTPAGRFDELADTQVTVARQRASSPTALRRLLTGDIGWIAIKALDSDPTKRYTSAASLAADLRRYLNGEPVEARAPSTWYRTTKFVRRNRVGVSIAASVAVGLTAFSAVTALQALRIAEERDRATLEAAKAGAFREVVTAPNPLAGLEADITVVEALAWGAAQVDAFGYPPDVAAAVRAAIGSAYLNVGMFEEADSLTRLALSQLEPGSSSDPDRAEALLVLGELYRYAGKPDSAEAALRAALEIRQTLFDGADVRVGEAYQVLGAAQRDGGELEEAEALLDSAVTIYERAGDDRRAAVALEALADTKWFAGDLGAAQELFERSIQLKTAAYGAEDVRVAGVQQGLAILFNETGQPLRALPLLEAAVRTYERLGAPSNELSSMRATLAQVLDSLGRVDEAEAQYRRQLEEVEARLPSGHQRIATSQIYLGSFLCRTGRAQEGVTLLTEAVDSWAEAFGADSPLTHRARSWLGYCHGRSGDAAIGRTLIEDALRVFEQNDVNPGWIEQAEQWLGEFSRGDGAPPDEPRATS